MQLPKPPPRPTPQEQHDQLQVNRGAEAQGELTSEQRKNLGRQYLENAQQTSGQSTTEAAPASVRTENIIYGILLADFDHNQSTLKEAHMAGLDYLKAELGFSLPGTELSFSKVMQLLTRIMLKVFLVNELKP